MTTSTFDKRVLIEQIRYIEAQQPLACNTENGSPTPSKNSDFEHRLWQRAQSLVKSHDLPQLRHAARLSRYANTITLIVAAILGAMGVNYAVTNLHTINIYWLLLVLLGFNFLSMLLWLTGISLNIKGLTTSMLARPGSWLVTHFKRPKATHKRNKIRTQADRAWLACHFSGAVGKWQLSKISHQLWLVYLATGLVVLVILLMVRQYDFVWGTTLLSDTAFVNLTAALSVPLEALGFATPSANQVMETRIGMAQTLTIEHRSQWAQFLLGALLCFGLFPRILLWIWSALMTTHARRRFRLDYYLPYYIRLHQQLMPLASQGQIIDADTAPPSISETPVLTPVPHVLPDKTQWVAVELGNNVNWPPASVKANNNLGQVVDSDSLASIVQRLQSNHCPVIAVAVSSARPTDRGVQRVIASLMSNCEQRWLVLLHNHENEAVSSTRLAAWYRLAEACKVPVDHVISMNSA